MTTVEIGGEAAAYSRRLFLEWESTRTTRNCSEYSDEQWPDNIRLAADAWPDAVCLHRHRPPIVFYVEYVDECSFCPPQRFLGEDGLIQIMADRRELFCLELPFPSAVLDKLRQHRKTGQWPEDRQFAAMTLRAASAWKKLVTDAVLVFIRQVVGGAVEDDEIADSLKAVPDWLA